MKLSESPEFEIEAPLDHGFRAELTWPATAMRITVIFSGLFSVLAEVDREVLEVAEGTTIERLSDILKDKYHKLPIERSTTYFVINGRASTRDQVLAEGDQVRVFQLLGGG